MRNRNKKHIIKKLVVVVASIAAVNIVLDRIKYVREQMPTKRYINTNKK